MTFLIQIKNGKLDFGSDFNSARWHDFLKNNESKWIRIEKPKVVRTLSQNSTYWLYLDMISRETGNEATDLHEFFKQKLLPRKLVVIKGRKTAHQYEKVQSTTELSKLEFGEYIDRIGALTGIPLPDIDLWKAENGYLPS